MENARKIFDHQKPHTRFKIALGAMVFVNVLCLIGSFCAFKIPKNEILLNPGLSLSALIFVLAIYLLFLVAVLSLATLVFLIYKNHVLRKEKHGFHSHGEYSVALNFDKYSCELGIEVSKTYGLFFVSAFFATALMSTIIIAFSPMVDMYNKSTAIALIIATSLLALLMIGSFIFSIQSFLRIRDTESQYTLSKEINSMLNSTKTCAQKHQEFANEIAYVLDCTYKNIPDPSNVTTHEEKQRDDKYKILEFQIKINSAIKKFFSWYVPGRRNLHLCNQSEQMNFFNECWTKTNQLSNKLNIIAKKVQSKYFRSLTLAQNTVHKESITKVCVHSGYEVNAVLPTE